MSLQGAAMRGVGLGEGELIVARRASIARTNFGM